MGTPSTRPSTKGYTPVPMEERIDDDVETPADLAEAGDDDDLYTSSAPLLSSRSRGNEPPPTQGKPCWYHQLTSFRLFRRDPYHHSWEAPSKPRNWRRIFLFSLFSFMLAAIIALATSTGVIASEYQHYRSTYGRCTQWNYERHTRLPKNEAWKSSNGRLDFRRVYPPLKASPSSACQIAWNTLKWVPCHEKIWNRSWDNGKHSLFDPEISLYASEMCTMSCTDAINEAVQLISAQCTEEDKFDMTGYTGPMTADSELEDGPVAVITTIAKRLAHTCRKEPLNYWSKPYYCTTVMWEDWLIVDGMNTGNLEGLDAFKAHTRTTRFERAKYDHRYIHDKCDDASYNYSRSYSNRRYGPDINSTTCGWCTMNWFERKLLGWKDGEVRDPKSGEVVGLKEYLRKIRDVGQRCDADAWNRIWGRTLKKYREEGDLPDGLENDGMKLTGSFTS